MALEYELDPEVNGCPEAAEFRSAVAHQLGYDPFQSVADRRVAVQIARKGAGFDGRIKWTDDRGRWVGDRRLMSRRQSCDQIAASLAFSVAVQIQLIATLAGQAEPSPPEPSPPEPSPPEPSPPEPPPAQPPQVPSPRVSSPPVQAPVGPSVAPPVSDQPAISPPQLTREATPPATELRPVKHAPQLNLSVGFGPSLALGLAPHATGLGRIFVSGRISSVSVEIALDAALPATQTEADGSGFLLDRFAAGAAACGHARAVAACVTATVGLLRARGFDVDTPASPAALFSQVGARLAASHDLGPRYFLTARVDGLVMLSSWTVTLHETALWTTPRVGVVGGLDLGVRFF